MLDSKFEYPRKKAFSFNMTVECEVASMDKFYSEHVRWANPTPSLTKCALYLCIAKKQLCRAGQNLNHEILFFI